MRLFFPLFLVSLLFSEPSRVLLLNINGEKDPEMGSILTENVESLLGMNQNVSLIPSSIVQEFIVIEKLHTESDHKKIVAHFNQSRPIDAAVTITLNAFQVQKQRQLLWVTGEQLFTQSAHLTISNSTDSTLFNGVIVSDTTIATGYCGIFTCTQPGLSVQEQSAIHSAILLSISTQITEKIGQLLHLSK